MGTRNPWLWAREAPCPVPPVERAEPGGLLPLWGPLPYRLLPNPSTLPDPPAPARTVCRCEPSLMATKGLGMSRLRSACIPGMAVCVLPADSSSQEVCWCDHRSAEQQKLQLLLPTAFVLGTKI